MHVAYFISFRTYETWLHGDERWSTDRKADLGEKHVPPTPYLERHERSLLKVAPVSLSGPPRNVVSTTIDEVCQHRGWTLHAVNVRTNHVHVVVAADSNPERVMTDFKAWATRRLTEAGLSRRGDPVSARHGSTQYLRDAQSVADAVEYVLNRQDDQSDRHMTDGSDGPRDPLPHGRG